MGDGGERGCFKGKELRGKIVTKIKVALWRRRKRDKSAQKDLCSTDPSKLSTLANWSLFRRAQRQRGRRKKNKNI